MDENTSLDLFHNVNTRLDEIKEQIKDGFTQVNYYVIIPMILVAITVIASIVFTLFTYSDFVNATKNITTGVGQINNKIEWINKNFGEMASKLNESIPRSRDPSGLSEQATKMSTCGSAKARYGLIIDAGSTSSRLYIYCWQPAGTDGIPWVRAAPVLGRESPWFWDNKNLVGPGKAALSAYETTPEDAWKSLEPLIEEAKTAIGKDPQTLAQTPLYLMATGGMRELRSRDKPKAEAILDRVGAYFATMGFQKVSPEIIKGEREGLYGWLAVNYLMGLLQEGNPASTIGTLEMGGASIQITSALSDPPQRDYIELQWGKTMYHLYSDSHLWGIDKAIKRVNSKPCYPKEFLASDDKGDTQPPRGEKDGDYELCKEAVIKELKNEINPGQYKQLVGNNFLAFSNYHHTQAFFELGRSYSHERLQNVGRKYCETRWKQIKEEQRVKIEKKYIEALRPFVGTKVDEEVEKKKEYWKQHCFSTVYIVTLLHEGYGFPPNTQNIITTDALQGHDISWTLGAMIDMAIDDGKKLWQKKKPAPKQD